MGEVALDQDEVYRSLTGDGVSDMGLIRFEGVGGFQG
jgi:hypothetical protein